MSKPVLDILAGRQPVRRPVWLMRQAGRYLPEYRALRSRAGGFLDLCLTPDYATEITLQPIRRFGMDAAILFADILLVPMALGRALEFREGEGPVLPPLTDVAMLDRLAYDTTRLQPVYETVRRTTALLPDGVTLIGFCGSPWTVACYMLDGNSHGGFALAKGWAERQSDHLDRLLAILTEASFTYLSGQIEAGAEVVQLFDSWAGLLTGAAFDRFVIAPTRQLVARLKTRYPHIPIIGFPRAAGDAYAPYAATTGVDALGLDQAVDLDMAARTLQPHCVLQGNLDPALLVAGGSAMTHELDRIMRVMGPRHIVNLGHGVVPQTPPDHVAALVDHVHRTPL